MFETAVLSYGNESKRIWATCMGFTGQALVVTCAVLAPMIWPQAIPRVMWSMTLAPPTPPPAPPPPGPRVEPQRATKFHSQFVEGMLPTPIRIPDKIAIIEDPPDFNGGGGVKGGVIGGVPDGVVGGLPALLADEVARIVPLPKAPPPAVTNAAPPPPAPPPAPVRISQVRMATPIHWVEPLYPQLAIAAHISGTVELMGVLGVDGRLHELRVVRGHALLIQAAVDAVQQWVYAPTMLNGQAVEVQAPITVNFILNR